MYGDLDFYEVLKDQKRAGIDPCLSREENTGKLKMAFRIWKDRSNDEANVTKSLIIEALIIFNNEDHYIRFRKWYIKYKLSSFLSGALQNRMITEEKMDEIKKISAKAGINKYEISVLVKDLNIIVIDMPYNKSQELIHNFIEGAVLNGEILIKKIEEAKKKGMNIGLTEDVIDSIIRNFNVNAVSKMKHNWLFGRG